MNDTRLVVIGVRLGLAEQVLDDLLALLGRAWTGR